MLLVVSMLEISLSITINLKKVKIRLKELVEMQINTITRAHRKLVTNKFIFLTRPRQVCISKMEVLSYPKQKVW